jgi:hypothetical protein
MIKRLIFADLSFMVKNTNFLLSKICIGFLIYCNNLYMGSLRLAFSPLAATARIYDRSVRLYIMTNQFGCNNEWFFSSFLIYIQPCDSFFMLQSDARQIAWKKLLIFLQKLSLIGVTMLSFERPLILDVPRLYKEWFGVSATDCLRFNHESKRPTTSKNRKWWHTPSS